MVGVSGLLGGDGRDGEGGLALMLPELDVERQEPQQLDSCSAYRTRTRTRTRTTIFRIL